MLSIKNVSLRAFAVALRWAKMKGYPSEIATWSQEQSDQIQAVAEEYDRRRDTTKSPTVKFREVKSDA